MPKIFVAEQLDVNIANLNKLVRSTHALGEKIWEFSCDLEDEYDAQNAQCKIEVAADELGGVVAYFEDPDTLFRENPQQLLDWWVNDIADKVKNLRKIKLKEQNVRPILLAAEALLKECENFYREIAKMVFDTSQKWR